MAVCGVSLYQGSTGSRKTLEQKFIFQIGTLKAGFHMIAGDRRRSQRETFPYNRRRSQAIAEPTAAYISDCGSVKITRALC